MLLSNGSPILGSQIDTIADTTPLFADASYYPPASGLQLTGQWAAYGALYRSQLWVGTVVRKLAFGTARLPFDIKRQGEANQQNPEPGPLADLMARPNERLSGFKLWLWTSSTFDVYGEAFWLKVRDKNDQVRELHPMHPTNVIVRRDPNTGEMFYIYATGVRNVNLLPPIPERDVVAFTNYNPDNLLRGLSNLESLRMTLLNEDSSRRATASWWQRGARPSVALKHPGQLSTQAQQRLVANWEARHAGADLMGGTAILEEGMEAQVIQLSSEEMQYIESRKLNREEVCSAYDVPPPVVHILDHATYSNITEQMRSQYRDTMAPRLALFESVVNHNLVADFDSTGAVFTRFNMDEVLRGDFETRAEAVNKLVTVGILKPSEGRPMFGLAQAGPEADQLYGNAALVPLGTSVHGADIIDPAGQIVPDPAAGGPPPPMGRAVPRVLIDQRAMARRAGRAKANGLDMRAALVEDHRKALVELFERQRADAKASAKAVGGHAWDDELAALLSDLGTVTAKSIGTKVAKALGGTYDVGELADWLMSDAQTSATRINAKTLEQIKADLANDDDPDAGIDTVFDDLVNQRAGAIASSRVQSVGEKAGIESAHGNGATTKTWVSGPNPRSSHARMNGESVPLHEPFSNGMNGPGDIAGGPDEVAGCNCDLTFD